MPRKAAETPQRRAARTKKARRGEAAPSPRLGVSGRPLSKAGEGAKQSLLLAFEKMGGVDGLVKWGKKNPTEFYRIWARLVPKEDNVNVTALGVEELLAQLDEADAASRERLEQYDEAGARLGLQRPSADEDGTTLALRVVDGGKDAE